MKKKFVEQQVNGAGNGTFVLEEASWTDIINPLVPVDSETSIARVIAAVVLTALIKG